MRLSAIETDGEASSMAYLLLEEIEGVGRGDIIINPDKEVVSIRAIKAALKRMEAGEPLQYVVGKGSFYGRSFLVNPSVLIPRTETEELVRLILDSNPKGRVLDIGTGGGAIAITLALENSNLQVEACDISEGALKMASTNAANLKANIKLFHTDILTDPIDKTYSVIVSNPPYVRESERALMSPKVYEHEPELALFVKDGDPLLFYRVIAEKSVVALDEDGWLFFEINEALGCQTKEMLSEMGYRNISVIKDLFDKDRMVKAQKP